MKDKVARNWYATNKCDSDELIIEGGWGELRSNGLGVVGGGGGDKPLVAHI